MIYKLDRRAGTPPNNTLVRNAVEAEKVAPVGYRNTQVLYRSRELVL